MTDKYHELDAKFGGEKPAYDPSGDMLEKVPEETVVEQLDAPGGFEEPMTEEDMKALIEGLTGTELGEMRASDDAQIEKDAERFDEKQRAWAHDTAQAYLDKHPMDPASRRAFDPEDELTPEHLKELLSGLTDAEVQASVDKHAELDPTVREPNPLYDIPMVEVKDAILPTINASDFQARQQAAHDKGVVMERMTTNVGPDYGSMHRIMAGPDGRGCVQEGFPVPPGMGEDPATWPLPPSPHPSPRPTAADKDAQRKLEEAIERLGEEKEKRDREEAQATIRGDLGPEDMETLKQIDRKDTNPKDAVGIRKWRVFTTVPFTIIWELGVAMMEGARKYGRHNYRVAGVRGSVYIDAAMGHLTQWWEGEDNDLDTGLSHITKAMASLCVLRDAMIQNKFVDDRPPKTDVAAVRDELQTRMDEIFERIPEAVPAYVEGDQHDSK